jgi:hypothetical protein
MDGKKKPLSNFFKLDALGRKGHSSRRKQNGSPNYAPLGKKGLNHLGEQFPMEKGIKLPWGTTSFGEKRIKGRRPSLREKMDLEI